jgi:hypothetical protein
MSGNSSHAENWQATKTRVIRVNECWADSKLTKDCEEEVISIKNECRSLRSSNKNLTQLGGIHSI